MEQLIRRLRRHGHDLPRRKRPRPLVVPAERNLDADRYLTTSGYVRVRSARKDEHVLVMEAVLGRELLPGETVHHRNAVRNDNRPENLQLRVRGRHPRGASVEDLLAWAREVVELYGPLELALA